MTKKQLLEYLLNEDKKFTDKEITLLDIEERLKFIPNKLYRYRSGTKYDFDAIENDYLWFSQPKDCDDKIDYTLKYDIKKQSKRLVKYIQNNYEYFVLDFIKKCIPEGIELPEEINVKQIKFVREKCFDAQGQIIEEEAIEYMKEYSGSNAIEPILIALDKLKGYLNNSSEDLNHFVNTLLDTANTFNQILREMSMVCCFSDSHNNSLLWSKYSKEYSGYCIEYDISNYCNVPLSISKNLMYLFPVFYGEKKEFDLISFFTELIDKDVLQIQNSNIYNVDFLDINFQLLTKDKTWSEQKEWRICLKYQGNNKQYFPFMSAIYIGCNTPKYKIEKLIRIGKKKAIKIYKQELDSSGSRFVYKRIF